LGGLSPSVLIKNHLPSNLMNQQTAKFFELFVGPYKIHKRIGHNVYEISDLKGTNIKGPYYVNKIKKYHYREPNEFSNLFL